MSLGYFFLKQWFYDWSLARTVTLPQTDIHTQTTAAPDISLSVKESPWQFRRIPTTTTTTTTAARKKLLSAGLNKYRKKLVWVSNWLQVKGWHYSRVWLSCSSVGCIVTVHEKYWHKCVHSFSWCSYHNWKIGSLHTRGGSFLSRIFEVLKAGILFSLIRTH